MCRLKTRIRRRCLIVWRGEERKPVGPVVYSDVCGHPPDTGDDAYVLEDRGDMGARAAVPALMLTH